jgi:outer membrane protein OmpA-like peptidoglycan-associated protein
MGICFYSYKLELDTLSNQYENKTIENSKKLPAPKSIDTLAPKIQKQYDDINKQYVKKNEFYKMEISIQFDPNTLTIKKEYFNLLETFIKLVKTLNKYNIRIEGNCATLNPNEKNINESEVNQRMSLVRAQNVANYLEENGIDIEKITVTGNGSTKPLGDNRTEKGREQNRRVDIILTLNP